MQPIKKHWINKRRKTTQGKKRKKADGKNPDGKNKKIIFPTYTIHGKIPTRKDNGKNDYTLREVKNHLILTTL